MTEPGYGLDQFQILTNVQNVGDHRYKDGFKMFFLTLETPKQTY